MLKNDKQMHSLNSYYVHTKTMTTFTNINGWNIQETTICYFRFVVTCVPRSLV